MTLTRWAVRTKRQFIELSRILERRRRKEKGKEERNN